MDVSANLVLRRSPCIVSSTPSHAPLTGDLPRLPLVSPRPNTGRAGPRPRQPGPRLNGAWRRPARIYAGRRARAITRLATTDLINTSHSSALISMTPPMRNKTFTSNPNPANSRVKFNQTKHKLATLPHGPTGMQELPADAGADVVVRRCCRRRVHLSCPEGPLSGRPSGTPAAAGR